MTSHAALNLDDCNVTYSPYVGKGYPVFIHRTRTIVARDTEDVMIVRFCVAMIPKLEKIDREMMERWQTVRDAGQRAREPSPEWMRMIQEWRQQIGDTAALSATPTFAEVVRMIEWQNAHRFDDWPDYGAMLVRDVTAFWSLPWWRRGLVRLQRYLHGDEQ